MEEEKRQDKAQKRRYKYRELFTGGTYYTEIPIRKVGLRGQELTQANIDKTQILIDILKREEFSKEGPKRLLGELQYAFISFVMGENLESFEHWK